MARSTVKPRITYTEELGDDICLAVAVSPYMLEELCNQKPHWPCAQTIYEWRIKIPSFGEKYARAKQAQIEVLVERIFLLSRSKKDDYLEDKDGVKFADNVAICNKRHEIDSIKWLASKLAPKLYGDKKQTDDNDKDDFISKNREHI